MSVQSFSELVDKFNLYINAIEAQFQVFNEEIVVKTKLESLSAETISDDELKEYVRVAKTARENIYKMYSIIDDFIHQPELALAWRTQFRSHKAANPAKVIKGESPDTLSSLVSGLKQSDLDKLIEKLQNK